MSFSDYLAIDAVNYSSLKEMLRSPRHYLHRLQEPTEDTRAMAMGRATHTAVFEPDRFMLDYALFDGERRAGKEWAACLEANPGKTILKRDEYETCLAMRDAVRSHPVAGPALTPPGEAEKVITWTDERTGLACKARLDWYRVGLLADLKTTANLDEKLFAAHVFRMSYYVQGAFYRAGLRANELDVPPWTIIGVESAAPHDVGVFELDDDALWQGELAVAECLDRIAAGRNSQQWPGRYPEKRTLSLPRWAFPVTDQGDDFTALGLSATGTED